MMQTAKAITCGAASIMVFVLVEAKFWLKSMDYISDSDR